MQTGKIILIVSVAFVFGVLFPCVPALSGSGEAIPVDPSSTDVQPPEAWGVIVADFSSQAAAVVTVRVKRVVNCAVETDVRTIVGPCTPATTSDPGDCYDQASDFLYLCLPGLNLFNGAIPNPVITKIKNPTPDGSVLSFDAQIMNYTGKID